MNEKWGFLMESPKVKLKKPILFGPKQMQPKALGTFQWPLQGGWKGQWMLPRHRRLGQGYRPRYRAYLTEIIIWSAPSFLLSSDLRTKASASSLGINTSALTDTGNCWMTCNSCYILKSLCARPIQNVLGTILCKLFWFCWDLISPTFSSFRFFSANEFTDMAYVSRVCAESCELIKNVYEYPTWLTCIGFRSKAMARKEIHIL